MTFLSPLPIYTGKQECLCKPVRSLKKIGPGIRTDVSNIILVPIAPFSAP